MREISSIEPPAVTGANGLAELATLTEAIYSCCEASINKPAEPDYSRPNKPKTRWKRIIAEKDSKLLWHGIDWNGEYKETVSDECPSESAFQEHMERLLNPEGAEPAEVDLSNQESIPALDQPFTIEEVQHVIDDQMKPDKGCGPDGISPVAINLLPISWLLILLTILNTVFQTSSYPVCWATSKLIMLFKKGPRLVCGNYRGISVIDALAKLFDYLLNNRLCAWIQPDREQAGAQPGRGCIEHIVTLRLLFDYCKRKKDQKLFVAFIDFSKAYDRVPRKYLLELLKRLGCGAAMLAALRSMYKLTRFILGSTLIYASLGVKQGSPTSCFLFTLFVDECVKLIKDRSPDDGFLSWLHLLVLMDDTVLVSTTRAGLIAKLRLLAEWCDKSGMVINEEKTEFMAVASDSPLDKLPIIITTVSGEVSVKHCDSYTYLGAIFTSDGKVTSTMSHHVLSRTKTMNKLIIFLDRNKSIPYFVKKKVLDACFSTALLYGCEAWLGVKPSMELNAFYMKAIKLLLGVRQTTHNDVCLLESGYPSLEAQIKSRQQVFFNKMTQERVGIDNDPLMFAIELTHANNKMMSKYIRGLESAGNIIEADLLQRRVALCANKKSTRAMTYLDMNPGLSSHAVYTGESLLEDDLRILFTRFRVSSHRLRIETGRWSRTPPEERVCQCGNGVQSERHVLVECPLVKHIRQIYNEDQVIDFNEFVTAEKSTADLMFLREVLSFYE